MPNDTVSTTGSIPENLTGQHAHPPKSRVVSNDPTKDINGMSGQDGFKASSPKASVKLTTPAKVS